MGTRVHVVLVGGAPALGEVAITELGRLEARWSRFRTDSEISRLNDAGGAPVVVSPITFTLLQRAVAESRATAGAFDPTVLPALVAAGYDRDFASVTSHVGDAAPPSAAPGVSVVELDPVVRAVRLHPGSAIDVGGIAKGFAADHVAARLLQLGAAGACVNLGGDLRVTGTPPDGDAWIVAVETEPGDPSTTAPTRGALCLTEGGIATTSARRRVWTRDGVARHHVIDPRTGEPAVVPWASVTVVAGDATSAEVGATAAFLSPDLTAATGAVEARGAVGVAIDEAGAAHELGAIAPYLAWPSAPRDLVTT
jgi:thiamine biosynthesis lipoprotein